MTAEEYAELKADIKAYGLREPITLYQGKILDGVHRYRACRELRVKIKTRVWKRDGGQPIHYIISENVKRRHLTTGQRAALAVELRPIVERELAEKEPPRKSGGAKPHRAPALKVAAEYVKVHPSAVETYSRVAKEAPDLAKKVRAGILPLYAAHEQYRARQPQPKRKPPTVKQLSERAHTAATTFAKSVAALTKARGDLTFMELWAIWAAIFEVQGYLEQIARKHQLPVPETPGELKRLKQKAR
jgi:hypothetical protein